MSDPRAALEALSNSQKAAEMAAYHKAPRVYLGVSNPDIDTVIRGWRDAHAPDKWVPMAATLWDSNIHEARIGAAKLLTKARIADDAPVWDEICRWAPEFDAWAIADHACKAGEKRLVASPGRLEDVESWTGEPSHWQRRAALVITLPWAKLNHPSATDTAIRELVLGWAATYASDHNWFIQKAIGWWLRTLSKHDEKRVHAFLAEHGERMKPFAVREAVRII